MSSAFTPLEALLLFQYLSNYGVAPTVFTKISDLLRSDEQIRRCASYDPARLAPDALRDFYLRLLKEEARSEIGTVEGGGSNATNGDASQQQSQSGSRKRKAPSPSLPTIQEASRDAHLIPQLIRKLYARYREHAIIEIKEDERRYETLRRSIGEIKSGAWDERLQREIERGEWDRVLQRKERSTEEEERRADATHPETVNGAVKQPTTTGKAQEEQEEAWKADSDAHSSAPPSQSTTPAISPHPTRLPYSQQQPQPVPPQPPALSPRHASQSQSPIYPATGPSQQQGPYAPPQPHQTISPRPPDARASARPSQSPMLPPPPPYQSGQPFPPYPYANNVLAQQIPPHSPYAPPSQAPLPHPSAQTQQGSPAPYHQYAQHQSPYPPPSYAGAQGGVMLQPFAVAPQTPTGPRQQGQTPPNVSNARQGAPSMPPLAPQTTVSGLALSPFDIAKLLATPLSGAKKSLLGSAAPSPSKDTQWKVPGGRPGRGQRKASPARPQSRSVSPISERGTSPPPPQPHAEEDTARRPRRGKPGPPESVAASSRSARIRRARGASTTSSVPGSSVRGRTRSQSVISHAEDPDAAGGSRRVKHEPSTPMDTADFSVHPTIEGTPHQHTTRRGLGLASKRKRGPRDDNDSEASDLPQQMHPLVHRQDRTIVIANRNFNRLSATVMNDIQSHKHASLFGNPVRDRDAEGYSDIIRRPQDLKSIRAAITAGNRAVNAATASESFASSTGGSGSQSATRDPAASIIALPVSEDLVPPRAIVNSAQLECEVLRMFANAVMFNVGDAGVVGDAREMAESVESQIAKFREVERSSAAALGVGLGGAFGVGAGTDGAVARVSEEEGEEGGGKRRKVG